MEENNIQAAIEAGGKLASLQNIKLDEGQEKTFVLIKNGFNIEEIDNSLPRPQRKTGSKKFTCVKSFCEYVNKHINPDETVVIADENKGGVLAIINDHGQNNAAWGDFCAQLELGFSDEWKVWFDNSNKQSVYFDQGGFADFISDNRADLLAGKFKDSDGKEIENISALELGALVNNLQISSEEKIIAKRNPVSGEVVMAYENQEVGKKEIKFPEKFFLTIPIYKNGDVFRVEILLRYRRNQGAMRFFYIIDQASRLKQSAFDKVCKRITKGNIDTEENQDEQYAGVGLNVLKGVL